MQSSISPPVSASKPLNANHQRVTVNAKTGKAEHVFVNLEAVYPNDNEELSFEELRAKHRGWMDKDWAAERTKQESEEQARAEMHDTAEEQEPTESVDDTLSTDLRQALVLEEPSRPTHEVDAKESLLDNKRPKRPKIREIRHDSQTGRLFVLS